MENKENIEKISKDEKIDNKKNINIVEKIYTSKYFISSIIILIILAFFFVFKNEIITKFISKDIQKENENFYLDFQTEKELNSKNYRKIIENLKTLEKEIEYNSDYINSLQSKILELETKIIEINLNPQKMELIKTAINIQNDINNDLNYSINLTTLKMLSKDNPNLIEKIDILEQNKNNFPTNEVIKNDFDKELSIFLKENNLLKQNDNKVSKFLSNFIVVRKVDQVEENSTDFFTIFLENSIKEKNYNEALNILNNNKEYEKYWKKTLNNLKIKTLLSKTIEEIINYLINN